MQVKVKKLYFIILLSVLGFLHIANLRVEIENNPTLIDLISDLKMESINKGLFLHRLQFNGMSSFASIAIKVCNVAYGRVASEFYKITSAYYPLDMASRNMNTIKLIHNMY